MTLLEKFKKDYPKTSTFNSGRPKCCPSDLGYADKLDNCLGITCTECWNREIPEVIVEPKCCPVDEESRKAQTSMYEEITRVKAAVSDVTGSTDAQPHILDSGDRTEFETGAVRDMREGKGRCDLLPLDVVSECLADAVNRLDGVIFNIYSFQKHGDERSLHASIDLFKNGRGWDEHTMILEVAKHFEEGAKKYGDNNWRKGIPVRCYIDSAIRHYLKYLRGDKDEPHDRAFCWNILCAIWTCKHMPELNDYAKKESEPT